MANASTAELAEGTERVGEVRGPEADHEVRIYIDTRAELTPLGVGQFLEEMSYTFEELGVPRHQVSIVSLRAGSIELVVAVASLAVSMAQFAFQLIDRMKGDPLLSRSVQDIALSRSHVRQVTITAAGQSLSVSGTEIHTAATLVRPRDLIRPPLDLEAWEGEAHSKGFHAGSLYRTTSGYLAALEVVPDRLAEIVDRRPPGEPPLAAGRWLLHGELHLPSRRPARFLLDHGSPRAGPSWKWYGSA